MVGMTTDDPATGLTRLDALITPDLWSHVDGANRSARVGWGTMLNVAHLVRGIRTLHAAGQCHAAVPLLRSAIEYTAGTIWLADAGEDAVDVPNRGLQYSHGKLLKHLGGIGVDLDASFPAEAVQVFRDTMAVQLSPHPDEWLIRFSHLLAEYGFDKVIPVTGLSRDRPSHALAASLSISPTRDQTTSIWFAGRCRSLMSQPANDSMPRARLCAASGPATSSVARLRGFALTAASASSGWSSLAGSGVSIRARPWTAEWAVALSSRW